MELPPLAVIETADPAWAMHAREALAAKKNFFLLFQEGAPEQLGEQFPALNGYPFRPLEKFAIYLFKSALKEQDFARLVKAERAGAEVYFVEQKTLRPTTQGRFIVYCEIRGVVSEHNSFETAEKACVDYVNTFSKARQMPEAGIYEIKTGFWRRLQSLC